MERKKLICIGCPKGCELTVFLDGKQVTKVEGNHCKKGARSNSSDQDRDEHCYGAGR